MAKIVTKLDKMLEKRNKSAYWLNKQTGISNNSLGKIARNETTSINFDVLAKICVALECKVEDILECVYE